MHSMEKVDTSRQGGAFPGMPINIKPFLVLITHLTEL